MSIERDIFKKGSTTYYWSSKFFPKNVRDDVFKLYSFVRVVDDYVDKPEPDIESFNYIVHRWKTAKRNLAKFDTLDDSVAERVLQNIVYIVHRFDCDPAWVDAFLASMKMDIDRREYKTLEDTLEYIYGSAEVIGLFMAKILELDKQSKSSESHSDAMQGNSENRPQSYTKYGEDESELSNVAERGKQRRSGGSADTELAVMRYARMQGRAMQYINFIRDIHEDIDLGRRYFPERDLKKFGLTSLGKEEAEKNLDAFKQFVELQLARYEEWQQEADKGLRFIPKRLRVAVKTAVDGYNWTTDEIRKNPMIIYEKKVKPRKRHLVLRGLSTSVRD